MSDFDDVLERLLNDPAFKAAVAADPQRALAGYRLDPEERELLGVQFVAGEGEERTVEIRTNKSGVVGLVGPVAAALGVAVTGSSSATVGATAGGGALSGTQALGEVPGTSTLGHVPPTGVQSFGTVDPDGTQSLGARGGAELLGAEGGTQSLGAEGGTEFLGAEGGTQTLGAESGTQSFGTVDSGANIGTAPVEATGYHTRVDVDGDGTWDAHTVFERADGGVDIVADVDNDGRVDFVGHDYDRDGLVDAADFDNDGDGVLETRMHDDTGDGWMDRSERIS